MSRARDPDHRCPQCGGSLTYTGRKERFNGTGGHHVRVYRCGNCDREVRR